LREEQARKVNEIRHAFGELRGQIRRISDMDRLTPEQVVQVNSTVHTLGCFMQERGITNPYSKIYSTVWRMAGVGTTERIPQVEFTTIMEWLERQIQILLSAPKLAKNEDDSPPSGMVYLVCNCDFESRRAWLLEGKDKNCNQK